MPDNLSPQDRRKTMKAVRSKRTNLERKVHAMLAGMGTSGWRKNVEGMIGKPDIVFTRERVVIFVDGCFWHGCPECSRPLPKSNSEYWRQKIARNSERDEVNTRLLEDDHWRVIRLWEHEIKNPVARAQARELIRIALGVAREEK